MAAQVKAAKDALDHAVTTYKHLRAMVIKSLNSGSLNERTLINKMKSLNEALATLNSRHTTWSMKVEFTDVDLAAEKYSTAWLEEIWAAVDDIQDQVDEKLSSTLPVTHTNEQKLDICCKQMETLKLDIQSKVDNLLERTISNINSVAFKMYEDMLSSVQNCISGEFNDLTNNIMALDQVNVARQCLEFEEFRRVQQGKIVTIQFQLAENVPSPTPASAGYAKGVEMEKSKAPSFFGKTIDYPEFKRGWKKVAGVAWDDGNQVEQIKFKVDLDTKRIISRCNTMEEVWDVLDAEYAQEQEVINAVDEELRSLRAIQCTTPEYIVKLRNHLPNLEEALRNVEGLDHLCSPDRVNFLATKFDERAMHDWDYFRSKASGTTYERFKKFLLDRYDAARSSIARSKSNTKPLESSSHEQNHLVSHTNAAEGSECRRCRYWIARDSIHTCPGCGRGTAVGERLLHCLEHCGAYMRMNVNERSACIEKAKWCPVHLLGSHSLSECNMVNDSKFICGTNNCKMHHHKTLHGSTTPFVAKIYTAQCINESGISGAENVLLSIQSIPTATGSANCMFDSGASCCLITKGAAEHMNLSGEPMSLTITTVNGTRTIDSFAYTVPLIDKDKERHLVTALEVESISDNIIEADVSAVKHMFSSVVQDKWDQIKSRPKGEIDLLLGQNVCGLHPVSFESRGNLKVLSSPFGCGFVLTGTHPAIRSQKVIWNEDVSNIRHFSTTSHNSSHVYVNSISVRPNYEYFELDDLGVQPPRRCGNCLNCKDCSFRGHMLTQQEQYEYQILESKVRYDPASQSFHVSYPFIEDPSILPNNKGQVIKIAEREEKRLIKSGLLGDFNQEFVKMIKHGALIELTPEEMSIWDGPTHYVSLQHVINEDSMTTPIRIVTNSSLSSSRGVSLNSILMKGPNTLSDQWAVLNRWRSYEVAMCSDVTKAYYSLRTGEVEKHVRRVCWRYGQQNTDWKVFAFCTVSFGDRPAAAFLEIAIKKTAEYNNHIDPEAAFRIINDRYVDDFASGGNRTQVTRFVGNEIKDFQCDGTLPTILSKSSLRLKVIVTSGETNEQKIAKLGGKVLGIEWNPSLDKISIAFKVSLATDKNIRNNKLTLSPHSLETFDKNLLNARNLLGIVNGVYDPLGLVAPITARLRVAFRNLFHNESPFKWDDPIPPGAIQDLWMDLICILVNAEKVTFPRATKPVNAVGECQLICYFDGSDVAYAAAIYIRWTLSDQAVVVMLLCAKLRVTPLQRISTPRSELNGAVLASRLLLSSLRSLSSSEIIPARVWIIGDSECTLASLEKVNAAFGEYFGNRIGEIIDTQAKIERICPVGRNGEWWHTSTHNNGADRATRLDSSIQDIEEGSEWQTGPQYLKRPFAEWPINRDFAERKDEHIPQSELLKRFRCLIQNIQAEKVLGVNQLLDAYSTNYWDKLINKTQLLLIPFHKKKYDSTDEASRIAYAKKLWFLTVMPDTIAAMDSGKLKELDVQEIDGLKVVCGRASVGLQKFFGNNHLPIVMGHSRVAYLLMLHAHDKDHAGRDVTMAMSRHDAWIVNAKRLSKKIVRKCIRCRFLRKQLEGQKMAVIPAILQVPCPPFTNIAVDLTGPFLVKSMTNKRSTMKVWVVIFLCLNTKAISMELSPGYSTDDFLIAYSSHVSIRGIPSFVHSDRGSQLVAAHKDICDDPLQYDWDAIASSTASQGTLWKFAPAGGQWRNGAAESFVKKFKLSFLHLYRETKFNYAELGCAVKRISNILNDRPVSVQRTKSDAQDEEFLTPLTPNMLITGRNANGPPREYVDVYEPQMRKSFIEELEAAWWYQYKVQYFDSLIPTRKWIETRRNMSVGDVVLIQYSSKSAPGTYRLGRVTDIEVDDDGLVRTCTVKYNLTKHANNTASRSTEDVVRKEVRVPVQRLVLILPVEEQ